MKLTQQWGRFQDLEQTSRTVLSGLLTALQPWLEHLGLQPHLRSSLVRFSVD